MISILLHTYTILLDPRTKKNHQVISGCGPRCPICKKHKRQFVRNGSAASEFSFQAAKFLFPKPQAPLQQTVHIVYRLYMKTKRKVDDLNLYAALDDLLVREGILKDDNIHFVRNRDGSRVLYDKDNPRAEIYIYDYKEEEDGCIGHQDLQSGQVSGSE